MGALPIYRWCLAPEGLATYRQLRAAGLRPGGQPVVAQLERPRRRRGPLVAYLYRIDLAKPVRPMTHAKWAALAKANAGRRRCPQCRRDAGYVIPVCLGMCVTCAYPDDEQHGAPVRRTDAVRMHSEEAAALSWAAETADEPTRGWLLDAANDHQAMADAARLGDYEHDELED